MTAAVDPVGPWYYHGGMVVKKLSISLDAELADFAARAAAGDGLTLSAWLARAVEHEQRVSEGLAAVAEFEAQHGAFTEDELAAADAALERMGIERLERR